jgi:hypothetical protein
MACRPDCGDRRLLPNRAIDARNRNYGGAVLGDVQPRPGHSVSLVRRLRRLDHPGTLAAPGDSPCHGEPSRCGSPIAIPLVSGYLSCGRDSVRQQPGSLRRIPICGSPATVVVFPLSYRSDVRGQWRRFSVAPADGTDRGGSRHIPCQLPARLPGALGHEVLKKGVAGLGWPGCRRRYCAWDWLVGCGFCRAVPRDLALDAVQIADGLLWVRCPTRRDLPLGNRVGSARRRRPDRDVGPGFDLCSSRCIVVHCRRPSDAGTSRQHDQPVNGAIRASVRYDHSDRHRHNRSSVQVRCAGAPRAHRLPGGWPDEP